MATKQVKLSSFGPFEFDDTETYPDDPTETLKALVTDSAVKAGEIKVSDRLTIDEDPTFSTSARYKTGLNSSGHIFVGVDSGGAEKMAAILGNQSQILYYDGTFAVKTIQDGIEVGKKVDFEDSDVEIFRDGNDLSFKDLTVGTKKLTDLVGSGGTLPAGVNDDDMLQWDSVSSSWIVNQVPVDFDQINLTPGSSSVSDDEGGVRFSSVNKHVLVAVNV